MKIKNGFAKRKIADSNIVVPVGRATNDFNGMITLNDSGSFFWDCLTHETTIDEVVEKVISEYDIDTETAKRDIEKFIKLLEDNKIDYPHKLASPCEFCEFLFKDDWFLQLLASVNYYENIRK